jgi:uncharacterized protein YdgA (DUF945 family)
MKKIATLALIIAVMGAGYTATSWYFGKQTEATLNTHYSKMLQSAPYVTIIDRDYRRGIFSSEVIMTLELFSHFHDKGLDTNSDTPSVGKKPIQLRVQTQIQHGPFPGMSTLAAAATTSHLQLPEEMRQDASELLGDKSPFTQNTTILFDGSGTASFSSPKFNFDISDPQSRVGESLSVAWEGFQGDVRFSADMKHITMNAKAPSLKISDNDGMRVSLSDLRLEGDQAQIFDDIAILLSGSQRLSVGEVAMVIPESGDLPFVMKGFSYRIDLPRDGEFIDLVERMGIERLQIGKDSLGPIHFDYSFKHLHTRAVAEISQAFMKLYTDPNLLTGDRGAFAEQLMPVLMQHAETILDNGPTFHIDRLSFANAEGEANLTGRVALNGLTLPEILANPAIVLTKMEANGELQLEEKMVLELLRNPPGKEKIEIANLSPEELEAQSQVITAQFQQQVTAFTEIGYITREGSLLKSHVRFKAGELLVNGKPFMPMGIQQPTPMQDEEIFQ